MFSCPHCGQSEQSDIELQVRHRGCRIGAFYRKVEALVNKYKTGGVCALSCEEVDWIKAVSKSGLV